MSKIASIKATEIIDSQGHPTLETLMVLDNDIEVKSSVPSGAISGTYEASILRDKDNPRFGNMGVLQAIEIVNKNIGPKLIGLDPLLQQKIDHIMIDLDATPNKGKLGANSILSVSQATAKAGAASLHMSLSQYIRGFISEKEPRKMPVPMFNLIEGGKHTSSGVDMQEFLIVPAAAKTFKECMEIGEEIYSCLRKVLMEKNYSTLVADEGGFSPQIANNEEAFKLLKQGIERSKFQFSRDVFLGLDASANTFHKGKTYIIKDKAAALDQSELIEFYNSLITEFGLIYIEDPFAEDDWEGWKQVYKKLSPKALIIGDDLTTTNPYRLQLALENNVINGLIIKPGQIGTVTETIVVAEIAKFKKLKTIVSGRSGDTIDDFVSDFAVGIGADFVKFGAPARERIFKYNRLIEIQQELEEVKG